MIRLQDGQIADILPGCFSDEAGVLALGFSIHKAMQRLLSYCGDIRVFAVIDTLPEPVLDRLALDLNTQYYEDSLEVGVKRGLVKNTMLWYARAGTANAVEGLISVAFGAGSLKEWWEYGGEPYCFRVRAEAPLTEDGVNYFTRIIQYVKNTRSHLEALEVFRRQLSGLYMGSGTWGVRRQAIADTFTDVLLHGAAWYLASGTKGIGRVVIKEED